MKPQNAQKSTLIVNSEFAGISPEVLTLNVQFVNDIEYDSVTKEVIATPIADALNLRYPRFGRNTQQNLTAALFIGENGETWQAKIFGENAPQWLNKYQNQGKRTGQYLAPKGIGDKPYLPRISALAWLKICFRYNIPLPEELLKWLEDLEISQTTLLKKLKTFCINREDDTGAKVQTNSKPILSLSSSTELSKDETKDFWMHLLNGSTKMLKNTLPLMPAIWQASLSTFIAEIQQQNQILTINFWDWFLEQKEIPVLVTEGAKKALAAISQGYVALSLFGCHCGTTENTLKPALLPYVEGRNCWIAFDRDSKEKTRKTVLRATRRLARAIAHYAKGKPSIMTWDGHKGKGIDDLIAHDPELFHQAIASAKSFDKWKLWQHSDLSQYRPIKLNCRYLDKNLIPPDDAKVIALKAPKGTGKTEWMAHYITQALNQGIRIIILSHREQLVKELSNRLGVAYRTQIQELPQGSECGYALCVDSLHANANPPFYADSWEGCWVILDEAEQVIWHLLNSKTCQYNRVAITESLTGLVNVAEKILVADADLSKESLNYICSLLEEPVTPWVVINEWQPKTRRIAHTYLTPESLLSDLLEAIRNGDRVIVHTGAKEIRTQWGTYLLESIIRQAFPEKRVLRIDADSVSDPSHPAYGCMGNLNAILPLYDVVIASPTIETGVSIDIQHFDRVFCFGTGTQTVEVVCQTLSRVRTDIPRHIWINERSKQAIANGSSDPYFLLKSQQRNFVMNKYLLFQADAIAALNEESPCHLKTWTTMAALHNYGFKHYREEIYERLTNEGYNLIEATEPDNREAIREEVKTMTQTNYQKHCEEVSQAPILNDIEHQQIKDKRGKTTAERIAEKKTDISHRYLTDEVTPELVASDDKGLYGQLQLHYYLTIGNPFLQQRDVKKVKKLSNQGKVFTPDLNHHCLSAKVKVLQLINIEQFLDTDRVFTNDSLREWYEFILHYSQDIKIYLNQTIDSEKDTAIAIAQRLLKLLNLKLTCIGQRREGGKRIREYRMMTLHPDDREAIFSRWLERDSAECHTLSINSFKDNVITS